MSILHHSFSPVLHPGQSHCRKVMVEGEIVTGNYEDKDTGKKIYTTEVYANRIEFAGAKMVDRPPFPEDAEGFLEIPEGMEEEMPFR